MVPASADSGREFGAREPNLRLLAALAHATGGRVDPAPAAVLAARPGITRDRTPLAPFLVPLVLALVLVDVALRRSHDAE